MRNNRPCSKDEDRACGNGLLFAEGQGKMEGSAQYKTAPLGRFSCLSRTVLLPMTHADSRCGSVNMLPAGAELTNGPEIFCGFAAWRAAKADSNFC